MERKKRNLTDNYDLRVGQLKSLMKRFESNPELLERYNNVIKEQLSKGIIENTDEKDLPTRRHYIPHHTVISPNKSTTKIRIVYDASTKKKNDMKSLNGCLSRRPVILEDMPALLLRFRIKRIGIIADIEKPFLQVGLQELDRDVTRFLWRKDTKTKEIHNNIETYRFTRIPFGIIFSPFLLENTIQNHLGEYNSAIASKIKDDIYVDNLVTGTDCEEDAINLYTELKQIFQNASMNLREWISNSQRVNDNIRSEDRLKDKVLKVLGIVWNTVKDDLQISTKQIDSIQPATTKTEVLATSMSTFDPLGWLTPSTIEMKIFLQKALGKG